MNARQPLEHTGQDRPASPSLEMTVTQLLDHLVSRYHAQHRTRLPELIQMAQRVEHVHTSSPEVPVGLARLLENLQDTLLPHMDKEERELFPVLRTGGHPFVGEPIGDLRKEHMDLGEILDRIGALTNHTTPPEGACNTWRTLYSGLAQFREDLIGHMHLENNVLFPAFEHPVPPKTAQTGSCGGGGRCGCQ